MTTSQCSSFAFIYWRCERTSHHACVSLWPVGLAAKPVSSQETKQMRVALRTINGLQLAVDVTHDSTVADLRSALGDAGYRPLATSLLFFAGQQLANTQHLAHLGLTTNSFVVRVSLLYARTFPLHG